MSSLLAFLGVAAIVIVSPRAGHVLRRSAIRRSIEGIAGAAPIHLGSRLAAERR